MKSDLNRPAPQPATSNFLSSVALLANEEQPATRFCLQNTFGFWELTFDGQSAVLAQHQALFYVAWLLIRRRAEPVHAYELASKVYDLFGQHPDFRDATPWLCRCRDEVQAAKSLLLKQKALEAILDSEDELDPVKTEALHELIALQEVQQACLADIADTAEATAMIVSNGLLNLHTRLATALDGRGNPHPLARAFAHHLLTCILMPSHRASAHDRITRFIYQPPAAVKWEISVCS